MKETKKEFRGLKVKKIQSGIGREVEGREEREGEKDRLKQQLESLSVPALCMAS